MVSRLNSKQQLRLEKDNLTSIAKKVETSVNQVLALFEPPTGGKFLNKQALHVDKSNNKINITYYGHDVLEVKITGKTFVVLCLDYRTDDWIKAIDDAFQNMQRKALKNLRRTGVDNSSALKRKSAELLQHRAPVD